MKHDLIVIVPSRGRSDNAHALAEAFAETCQAGAKLLFAIDDDDPQRRFYEDLPAKMCGPWEPMVPKLNKIAATLARGADAPFALGFMGDDHRPRTLGWDLIMLEALLELGSGVVYANDLLQGERLCTSWLMTSDIVRALGRMVPAPVEHMFCDNAVMNLAIAAKCLRYVPDVVIEHMHPLAGKSAWDPGYWRVNQPAQYQRDGATYQTYQTLQFDNDVSTVTELREARHVGDVRDR